MHAHSFALRAIGWSVAAFGVLRLHGVEQSAVLPLTQLQGRAAAGLFGAPTVPIDITLACSGADAIALATGFILAYPARWSARLAAAAGAVALVVVLNVLRIGTLGRTTSPAWFEALHVYLWPAALLLGVAAYVFAWMRWSGPPPAAPPALRFGKRSIQITRRFVVLSTVLLVLFIIATPRIAESGALLAVAGALTQAAAAILRFGGIDASAAGNVLWTGRGGFLVTQECISTPLIAVYLAAAVSYATGWRRVAAIVLTAPVFAVLATLRLLVVAVPAGLVEAPMVVVHAFYQWLVAGALIAVAAAWAYGAQSAAWRRAALATAVGVLCFVLVTPVYGAAIAATGALAAGDPQGALGQLPAFQVGLFAALCIAALVTMRWRAVALGFAALSVLQLAGFTALHLLTAQMTFAPDVRAIRAWALGAPVLLVWSMVMYGRPRT